jgi:hypothetical protein
MCALFKIGVERCLLWRESLMNTCLVSLYSDVDFVKLCDVARQLFILLLTVIDNLNSENNAEMDV